MNDSFDENSIETRIDNYIASDPLEIAMTSLSEIEELSSFKWSELVSNIKQGKFQLIAMGKSPRSFHIVANQAQESGQKLFNVFGISLIILAIGLAVSIDWRLILIAVLAPYMFKTAKGFYSQAILQGAWHSEKSFSFLFSRGVIGLVGHKGMIFHTLYK